MGARDAQVAMTLLLARHGWEVARAAFVEDPSLCSRWAQSVGTPLGDGRIEEVIAAIARLPPLAPAPGNARSLLAHRCPQWGV